MFDLSSGSFTAGRIGRLQTLKIIPTCPGDSFELDLKGLFRFSPLRRYLTVDALVDVCVAWMPLRHAYGDTWLDFIKDGVDETVTLPTVVTGTGTGFNSNKIQCLATNHRQGTQTLPKALPFFYNSFWNRYVRNPVFNELDVDHDDSLKLWSDVRAIPANGRPPKYGNWRDIVRQLQFGYPVCMPKRAWNVAVGGVDDADRQVSIAGNKLDIVELSRTQARYKSELKKEWFAASRYNDVMQQVWGQNVSIDADERPELIMRKTFALSGRDIDGHDDATLGQFVGKAATEIAVQHGRKQFNEHGLYGIFAVVRFPLITSTETNPVHNTPNPGYKFLSGDPDIWMKEPPRNFSFHEWHGFEFNRSPDADWKVPYGQWYREEPGFVHEIYAALQGFPFIGPYTGNFGDGSADSMPYYDDRESTGGAGYDEVFTTQQLGHWQFQGNVGVMAHRFIPGVKTSIFAGAD